MLPAVIAQHITTQNNLLYAQALSAMTAVYLQWEMMVLGGAKRGTE